MSYAAFGELRPVDVDPFLKDYGTYAYVLAESDGSREHGRYVLDPGNVYLLTVTIDVPGAVPTLEMIQDFGRTVADLHLWMWAERSLGLRGITIQRYVGSEWEFTAVLSPPGQVVLSNYQEGPDGFSIADNLGRGPARVAWTDVGRWMQVHCQDNGCGLGPPGIEIGAFPVSPVLRLVAPDAAIAFWLSRPEVAIPLLGYGEELRPYYVLRDLGVEVPVYLGSPSDVKAPLKTVQQLADQPTYSPISYEEAKGTATTPWYVEEAKNIPAEAPAAPMTEGDGASATIAIGVAIAGMLALTIGWAVAGGVD